MEGMFWRFWITIGTVVMQYTGLFEYTDDTPSTYACVGDRDGQVIKACLDAMEREGIDTEFHVYPCLSHGFGLRKGTCEQGWINDAVFFWEKHMK